MAFLFKQISLSLFSAAVSGGLMAAENHRFEFNWQNKYITQGRNNLPDSDLFSFSYQQTVSQSISAGFWYAGSPQQSYNELHLILNYHFDSSVGEFDLGYERLIFDQQEYDNELAASWSYPAVVAPAVDVVYSTEADGYFVMLSLSSEFQFDDFPLILSPYIAEGFDFGYVSSLKYGSNHFQLGIGARYPINASLQLNMALEHGIVHSNLKAQGERDETWITLGLQTSF